MPRFFHALSSVPQTALRSCSSGWWIIPNPSVTRSTLPLPPCLLSIPPALNFMSPKTIPKSSIPLSVALRLTIKTILMLTLNKMAYGPMPSQATYCPDAKQQYINDHFCYADKFAILTNGPGIVRHIAFLDDAFKASHSEIPVEKKSDSPDEDKSIGDSSALKPVRSDFFSLHPNFHPDTLLGDSAFDTIETYGFLRDEFYFSRALIPYNPRSESSLEKVCYNPLWLSRLPKDSSLEKYAGHCHEKGRSDRDKWACPKVHMVKGSRYAIARNLAVPLKRGAQPILMKTWTSVCFSVLSGILMNGFPFIK